MFRYFRLFILRRRARDLMTAIYNAVDYVNIEGRQIIRVAPGTMQMARKADRLLDRIARLDPDNATPTRMVPMLESAITASACR